MSDGKPFVTMDEFSGTLAKRGEKLCEKCGEIKPMTEAYFHKNQYAADGFRSMCRECRSAERTKGREIAASKKVSRLTNAARAVLVRTDSKYSSGLKDLVDIGFELWGGRQEFMQRWVDEYEVSPPGGMIRARLLSDFAKLVVKSEEKMTPQRASDMSDEDLVRSLRGFMERLEEEGDDDPGERPAAESET